MNNMDLPIKSIDDYIKEKEEEEEESFQTKTLDDNMVLLDCNEEKDDDLWRNSHPELTDKLLFALNSSKLSDAEIIVQDGDEKERFPVHRMILALQSPLFEKIFFDGSVTKEISLTFVKPRVFRPFLKYLYSDGSHLPSLSPEDLLDLWYLSLKCQTEKLTEIVKKELLVQLDGNRSIALLMLQMAVRLHDLEMKKVVLKIVAGEAGTIINENLFSVLDEKTIKVIMGQDTLNMSEVMLWDAMLKWGEAQCVKKGWDTKPFNIRMAISDIIQEIRFLEMDTSAFSAGPEKSGILKENECLAIRRKLSDPTSYSMPSPFSVSKRNRKCIRCKGRHCVHPNFNKCSYCNVAHCTILEPSSVVNCNAGCGINHCVKSFSPFDRCDCSLKHCDKFRINGTVSCSFCKMNHCVSPNVVCAECSTKHCRVLEAEIKPW